MRKYIFNYYARKKYLIALTERNEIVRYVTGLLVGFAIIIQIVIQKEHFSLQLFLIMPFMKTFQEGRFPAFAIV